MAVTTAERHILVIDNDPSLQALFRDVLEGEGYRVTTRGTPTTDRDEFLALGPDLLILDLVLDRAESGWRFLQRLKADPATAAVPVLVCSAAVEAIERARERLVAWSCAILAKPFDLEAFLALVRQCLEPSVRDAAAG